MQLILFLLISISLSHASELSFRTGPDWEVKEKLFGADYVLVEKSETPKPVIFKKMPSKLAEKEIAPYLKQIVENKVNSPTPWKNIKILSIEDLQWGSKPLGKLAIVEYTKNNIPHTSILGISPSSDGHYLVLFSDESLNFPKIKSEAMSLIKNTKIHN